jgi:hypothetical protein
LGSKLGWERANWFAADGVEPRDIYTFGRGNWFDAVAPPIRLRSPRSRSLWPKVWTAISTA